MRIIAAATLSLLMSAAAFAQTTPSTNDGPAPAGQQPKVDEKQSSPGATGAMQNEVGAIATSPQDVRKQNEAVGPAGKQTTSPGTVGATPGSDPATPKPK
ncbi:MAG: hypothetical protein DI534_16365 [Leifsonia xyli]|nr:MAG: hypothetical protein DI534_16365 [Leifsonia xyli]